MFVCVGPLPHTHSMGVIVHNDTHILHTTQPGSAHYRANGRVELFPFNSAFPVHENASFCRTNL